MAPDVFVRRARPQDAVAISRLNNSFANEGLMLLRTPEMISLAIDDYVVVQGPSGEILAFMQRAVKELGQTIVMVTHDPTAAGHADRIIFLADGRIVDEMLEPTADRVLDRLKQFGD